MKNLIVGLILLGFVSCKKECDGHFMEFENTTHRVMAVMVDFSENMNGRYEHIGSIPPAGSEVFEFPRARKYRVVFISTGYRERLHIIDVPPCQTTYYHANVQ